MWPLVSARPECVRVCVCGVMRKCVCAQTCDTQVRLLIRIWSFDSAFVCSCVRVWDYRFLPARLRRSLYGQSLHYTHPHLDVWSFCAFLCVVDCVCVWSVCQSAAFLQCCAPFDFCSLPPSLSPLPSFSLVSPFVSPLFASSLRHSSPFLIFFCLRPSLLITSSLISLFHLFLSRPSSFFNHPPPSTLHFLVTFISSHPPPPLHLLLFNPIEGVFFILFPHIIRIQSNAIDQ